MQSTNTQQDKKVSQVESLEFNIKISDIVLTPFNCAFLVNEILKGILYQKCQIPYPYSWMKNIVDKKRLKQDNEETNGQVNFTLTNHFRVVSRTYDAVENLMKGISTAFANSENCINEVIILLGTTPYCPKEIFSINVTPLIRGHNERNHIAELNKYQQKILRNIFLSQNWLDNIDASISCTNTYVFLKKCFNKEDQSGYREENIFVQARPLTYPKSLKHTRINLIPDHSVTANCCDNLVVFSDTTEKATNKTDDCCDENKTEEYTWYQSRDCIQGFKDCYVNKVSASELW